MTEQELRVKRANELLDEIERILLLEAVFNYWEDRCKVADQIQELHRMAIEPREDYGR
ncbi:hypothetical protein GAP31_096 [Cronobacter phage vB_CsaM_GAP31]|uniref:Uncharacterized protein n=1 Tax=Cronobacter phage vB_CsaM_GAP31 TaxID=1141135 RepID=K4F578_9CAUD|nr:hypothetical protein GAP31_096 [Cronobacter phage vB_CsaM_GAP31]AFC21276.1 hypothetical protein GAP31_096 [Cronobacter phage vB_CsaM_GAP31]